MEIKEIWRDIKGYEGLYQVSNMGRVKSLGNNKSRKEKILKFKENGKKYLQVGLYKNGKCKTYLIHRLVAKTFIPKIPGKEFVDHIDGNRQNNNVNNLRWCSQAENNNFDLAIKHKSEVQKGEKNPMYGKTGAWKGKTGTLHPSSKAVLCIELNKIFGSAMEASRELGVNNSHISAVCNSKQKSAGKHPITGEKLHWKYIELLHCYN